MCCTAEARSSQRRISSLVLRRDLCGLCVSAVIFSNDVSCGGADSRVPFQGMPQYPTRRSGLRSRRLLRSPTLHSFGDGARSRLWKGFAWKRQCRRSNPASRGTVTLARKEELLWMADVVCARTGCHHGIMVDGRGSDEQEERARDPPSRSTLRRAEQGGPSAASQERGVVPLAPHDVGRTARCGCKSMVDG